MRLDHYKVGDYAPGASIVRQILWWAVFSPLVRCAVNPFSGLRVFVLRVFGAKIGYGVRIKPGVRIKFPWKLSIGDYSWIGEDVWIDNLATITVGSHVCLSQGTFLCTGNHDWKSLSFDLCCEPITIENHTWIGAMARVGPGTTLREGGVVSMGSIVVADTEEWSIYQGNPAQKIGVRSLLKA